MQFTPQTFLAFAFAALAASACASGSEESPASGPSEVDDLVVPGGKFDTAYYSNLATELEGTFTGTLILEGETDELEALDQSPYQLAQLARQQIKLAKNQLHEAKLHLNLTSGDVTFQQVEIDGGTLTAPYTVEIETLVTYAELEEDGLTPEEVTGARVEVTVAADPRRLFERTGETCASGFEAGSLGPENLFYYFDPQAQDCTVTLAPTATFEVHSLLPREETFPEYDRLAADGALDVGIFFGAAEDGAPHGGDWGVMMWRTMGVNLRLREFTEVPGLEVGQRYQRTRSGLLETIDLYSPFDLHDLGSDATTLFAEALAKNEVLVYNGHSFYGSLGVLDHAENYKPDAYQILFMNSCWSYEYYTKQVFTQKGGGDELKGWEQADVVNNTTYAWFSQMELSTRVFLTNLLAGVEGGGADDEGRRFSWQQIVSAMNDAAKDKCPPDADARECRFHRPRAKHEIYGVSGVRNNAFQPQTP